MKRGLKSIFLFVYAYVILGIIGMMSLQSGEDVWQMSSNGLYPYFILSVAAVLYFQLDIVIIYLPIILWWYKTYRRKKYDTLCFFLLIGYSIAYELFVLMAKSNQELEPYEISFNTISYIKMGIVIVILSLSAFTLTKTN